MSDVLDFSFRTPVEHSGPLPDAVDTVVVGGGIIGVMTAWFLTAAGQRVLLCEKGRIACEQSGRNWGWVRQQGRDPAELPIMIEAMRHWRALRDEIGDALGFRQHGVMYLATTAQKVAGYEAWLVHAREHGLDTRVLSSREVANLLPDASRSFAGALHTPGDAMAEPWRAVPEIARALARKGCLIRENCAVRTLDIAAGQVAGVVTESGRVRAANVVLAGGAWSSLFLRNAGRSIPQLSVRATVAATQRIERSVFEGGASDGSVAFRRRADGGYTLALSFFHELFIGPDSFRALPSYLPVLRRDPFGTRYRPWAPAGYPDAWGTARCWHGQDISPFERQRVLNPAPNAGKVDRMRRNFLALFPALGEVPLRASWAGMIDLMPDVVPVVDHVPGMRGLTVATGMSGHGFGIGPGFGRVVADMVLGRPPGHDMHRFRFDRFSEKLVLGPDI